MTPNIEELITVNYELEGLLYLALHRGDDTPQKVWDMISEKIDSLKSGISTSVNIPATPEEEIDDTPVMTEILVDEEKPVIIEEACSFTEAAVNETASEEEETTPCDEIELQETEETMPEADESTPEEPVEDEAVTNEEDTPVSEELPDVVNEAVTVATTRAVVEVADEVTETAEEKAGSTATVTPSTPELRLDEKLARQNSRDLKKAFSINDRFRFKRELFGNSDDKMNTALHDVEAMATIEEAHNYFYNTLGLDKTSGDVADFMAIIEHHLSAK